MNLEQRISNIERNTSTAVTGANFDVSVTSAANNDLLVYESSTSLWKNKQRKVLPTSGRIALTNTGSTQSLTNTTDITIGASAIAANQWSTTENLGSIFTLGATTGLVTVSAAGRYSIFGKIRLDSNTTGRRIFTLVQNGATVLAGSNITAVGNASPNISLSVPSFRLAASDTLELRIYQDSGTARTFSPGSANPLYFIVEYLGA